MKMSYLTSFEMLMNICTHSHTRVLYFEHYQSLHICASYIIRDRWSKMHEKCLMDIHIDAYHL